MEHTIEKTNPPVKKYKTAVIGCGRISVMHFDGIACSPLAKLVACCDVDGTKAEVAAKKYGCKAYTDYKEMIQKERPDAVHICLPHHLHAPHGAIRIKQRGKRTLRKADDDFACRRGSHCGYGKGKNSFLRRDFSMYCTNVFRVDEPIRITVIFERGKAVFTYDNAESNRVLKSNF